MIRQGLQFGCVGQRQGWEERLDSRRPLWIFSRDWYQTQIPRSIIKAIPLSTFFTPPLALLPPSLTVLVNTDPRTLCPFPCYEGTGWCLRLKKSWARTQHIPRRSKVSISTRRGGLLGIWIRRGPLQGKKPTCAFYSLPSTCPRGWQPDLCVWNVNPR